MSADRSTALVAMSFTDSTASFGLKPMRFPFCRSLPRLYLAGSSRDLNVLAVSGDHGKDGAPRIGVRTVDEVGVRPRPRDRRPVVVMSGGQTDHAGHLVGVGTVRPAGQALDELDGVAGRGHGEPQDVWIPVVPVAGIVDADTRACGGDVERPV